jgi:hypothetical protein
VARFNTVLPNIDSDVSDDFRRVLSRQFSLETSYASFRRKSWTRQNTKGSNHSRERLRERGFGAITTEGKSNA